MNRKRCRLNSELIRTKYYNLFHSPDAGCLRPFLLPVTGVCLCGYLSRSSVFQFRGPFVQLHAGNARVIRVPIPAMPFSSYRDGCGMVSNVHGFGPVAGWSAFRVHHVRAGNV